MCATPQSTSTPPAAYASTSAANMSPR
jgi:hypothetical protein